MMKRLVGYAGLLMLVVGVIFLTGCKSEVEPDAAEQTDQQEEHSIEYAAHMHDDEETGHIKQEVCPVMGNPINPELYAEHEGDKVYFCCPGCIGEFDTNPEQYIS